MRQIIIAKTDYILDKMRHLLVAPDSDTFTFVTSLSALDKYNDIGKVFFVHWSNKVPKHITDNYECICFHPTPLPYGRGGTPYQNMILAGHTETVITAFRMTEEMDAGPIYLTKNLSLSGDLSLILRRAYEIIANMIQIILDYNPQPYPQEGEVVIFSRRIPDSSDLPLFVESGGVVGLSDIYDFIRMLDDDTYPRAFIKLGDEGIVEFGDAVLVDNLIYGRFKICTQ
jgi:methionyl-tRNA formyltransferase